MPSNSELYLFKSSGRGVLPAAAPIARARDHPGSVPAFHASSKSSSVVLSTFLTPPPTPRNRKFRNAKAREIFQLHCPAGQQTSCRNISLIFNIDYSDVAAEQLLSVSDYTTKAASLHLSGQPRAHLSGFDTHGVPVLGFCSDILSVDRVPRVSGGWFL